MNFHKESSESDEGERDPLTQQVIGCAIEVHRTLGPGLLESVYEKCLAHELRLAGLTFINQAPLPIEYKGISLECGCRLDFLIDDYLVVELKAVEQVLPVHHAQLISYMRLVEAPVGLLINFNVKLLKDGIRRLFPSPSLSSTLSLFPLFPLFFSSLFSPYSLFPIFSLFSPLSVLTALFVFFSPSLLPLSVLAALFVFFLLPLFFVWLSPRRTLCKISASLKERRPTLSAVQAPLPQHIPIFKRDRLLNFLRGWFWFC